MKAAAKSIIGCGWTDTDDETHKLQNNRTNSTKLKLDSTEMTFSKLQLLALNRYLGELQSTPDIQSPSDREVSDVVERLVQRLLCGVGVLDSRFSSKFLIKLHEEHYYHTESELTQRFEYLIRLDKLSAPSVTTQSLEEEPITRLIDDTENEALSQGYVQIQVHDETLFSEFVTSNGFLRRDKIQERFVELLALAAGGASPNRPSEVDESILCGAPGKVIDAEMLNHILQVPPESHIFFGSNSDRYPDPRDFRLAVVEEPTGIRLRIGFLSPALDRNGDIEVYLILGIGFNGWPLSSDFPHRIEFTHPDFLIYYKTAQTGMYAVSIAPNIRCEQRAIIWRLCFPAARNKLMAHYGPTSVPNKVLDVLNRIHERINRQDQLKLVTKNILLTQLWLQLEVNSSTPSKLLTNWLPDMLAYHVLKILDRLILALRKGFQRSYIFPKQNIFITMNSHNYSTTSSKHSKGTMSHAPWNSCIDDDFNNDSELILKYLEHLYEESNLVQKFDNNKLIEDRVQTELTTRWLQIMTDLQPPVLNRTKRLTATDQIVCQFTKKQLEYLKIQFTEILKIHEMITGNIFYNNEQLLYLLNFILDQAFFTKSSLRGMISRAQIEKLKDQFFQIVLKDLKVTKVRLKSELNDDNMNLLVGCVFKWLYRALDEYKKFGPQLRQYLNKLFICTYENSWHIDLWKRQHQLDELKILGIFVKLVNDNCIKPLTGIADASNKGWYWAQDILELLQIYDLNLIFTPNAATKRYKLPSNTCNLQTIKNVMERQRNVDTLVRNQGTLKRFQNSLPSLLKIGSTENLADLKVLSHSDNRDFSPMTRILESARRYGQHRCLGDLTESLVALNKFSILQEISTYLPDAERLQMLDTIHRISKGNHRRHVRTLRSNEHRKTLPRMHSTGTYTLKTHEAVSPTINIEDVQVDGTKEYQNDIKTNWQQLVASNFFEQSSMEDLIDEQNNNYDNSNYPFDEPETNASLILHRSKAVTKL